MTFPLFNISLSRIAMGSILGYVRRMRRLVLTKGATPLSSQGSHWHFNGGHDDSVSYYASLLRYCGDSKAIAEGRQVHARLLSADRLHRTATFLPNLLIQMYGKCGRVDLARTLFERMVMRDGFSWTAMMAAYALNGQPRHALALFNRMVEEEDWGRGGCVAPYRFAVVSALSAAGSLCALSEGRRIHRWIIAYGGTLASDTVLETAVLSMYVKCGCLADARAVFDSICRRDAVSWSAMIAAYARYGYLQEAMHLFGQMKREGFMPGTSLILFLLNTFTDNPPPGGVPIKEILEFSASTDDIAINTALANMYSKHGFLSEARSIFDRIPHHCRDLISWSAMISAYAHNGLGEEALHLFWQMDSKSVKPDKGIFLCLLSVCANMQSLRNGKEIHKHIITNGFEYDVAVSNGLLNMYGKCGSLTDAHAVFRAMPKMDAASWNAMIAACQLNSCEREALTLFEEMESEGVKPNRVTFLCLLNACARMASLEHCKMVHKQIISNGFKTDPAVRNALVNVYGKCGSLEDACSVFDDDDDDDEEEAVSWNSLLATYSHNGLGQAALWLFGQMGFQSVKPNNVTFLCVLDACSHAGLQDEAWEHFASMHNEHYQLPPLHEHYMCMIDLLVRAGCLDDAKDWIKNMPVHTDAASRRTFLAKSALGSDNFMV